MACVCSVLGVTHLPLMCSDMRSLRVHFGPSGPVMFFVMSAEFGKKIRNLFNMNDRNVAFYDPESDGLYLLSH